jgi:hypothetical protein
MPSLDPAVQQVSTVNQDPVTVGLESVWKAVRKERGRLGLSSLLTLSEINLLPYAGHTPSHCYCVYDHILNNGFLKCGGAY